MADGFDADPATRSGLGTLSTELVHNICLFLPGDGLLQLRSVCRRLRHQTEPAFAAFFFHTIETDLTGTALVRLETIASHPTFRLAVRVVRTGLCGRGPAGRPLGSGRAWLRTPSGALDLSCEHVVRFHDALARLTNGTTWEVNDGMSNYPEFDGTATTLSPADALHLFLSALRPDGGPRLRELRVIMRRHPFLEKSHQLPTSSLRSPRFREALAASLRRLELRYSINTTSNMDQTVALILAATNLGALELHNLGGIEFCDADRLLQTLAEPTLTVPALAELHLGVAHLSHPALSAGISRFQATLHTLRLCYISLPGGGWASVLETLAGLEFPRLELLVLYRCREYHPQQPSGSQVRFVFFCPLRMRQDALRACAGGAWDFTLQGWRRGTRRQGSLIGHMGTRARVNGVRYRGPAAPEGMRRAREALGADGSHYVMSRTAERLSSPELPDMYEYEDAVGRLCPGNRFD